MNDYAQIGRTIAELLGLKHVAGFYGSLNGPVTAEKIGVIVRGMFYSMNHSKESLAGVPIKTCFDNAEGVWRVVIDGRWKGESMTSEHMALKDAISNANQESIEWDHERLNQ